MSRIKGKPQSIEVLPTSGPGLLRTIQRLDLIERRSDTGEPDFDGEYSGGSNFTQAETMHLDAMVQCMDSEKIVREKRERSFGVRMRNWLSRFGRKTRWR